MDDDLNELQRTIVVMMVLLLLLIVVMIIMMALKINFPSLKSALN